MKRKVFTLLLTLFVAVGVSAQTRYKDDIASGFIKKTYTYAVKDSQQLKLDIYFPAGDKATDRAAWIHVHGGGFAGGSRDSKADVNLCTHLAKKGYVTASISYRLTRKGTGFGCDVPADVKMETFRKAVSDLRSATAFMLKNHTEFGIDTNRIIISGSSAGAETVLNAAYRPATQWVEGKQELPTGFRYAGVISFAGAMVNVANITAETAIPTMMFHGTADNLVPYATAPHHYCSIDSPGYMMLDGSYTIANRLRKLGKTYWLETRCGAGHEMSGLPMTQSVDDIVDFAYNYIILGKKAQIHTIDKSPKYKKGDSLYDFCDN